MTNEHRYVLGKVDYNERGRANCEAAITWSLCNGNFSAQAEIWKPNKSDIYIGGQCIEEVVSYFPNDAKAQRILAVWRAYHLNDMQAGTPAQTAFLETAPRPTGYPHGMKDATGRYESHYEWACRVLAEAGLNPDPNYLHDGKPYRYGTAWLRVELPADVVAEIQSWNEKGNKP